MRERAGLSQAQLAAKLGTRQGAITRLENPNYGRQSLSVLHKVADFFDVATWVEFVSFADLIRRTADLSPRKLTPASYREEFDGGGEPKSTLRLWLDDSLIAYQNYASPAAMPDAPPMKSVRPPPSQTYFAEDHS